MCTRGNTRAAAERAAAASHWTQAVLPYGINIPTTHLCVPATAQLVVRPTVADLVRLMSQVLMFTATMPETLQATAAKWQRKPVKIVVAPGDMSISESITQVKAFLI